MCGNIYHNLSTVAVIMAEQPQTYTAVFWHLKVAHTHTHSIPKGCQTPLSWMLPICSDRVPE